jgi:hypothetical protein
VKWVYRGNPSFWPTEVSLDNSFGCPSMGIYDMEIELWRWDDKPNYSSISALGDLKKRITKSLNCIHEYMQFFVCSWCLNRAILKKAMFHNEIKIEVINHFFCLVFVGTFGQHDPLQIPFGALIMRLWFTWCLFHIMHFCEGTWGFTLVKYSLR